MSEIAARFDKSFTRQEAIPEAAVARALAVLESGRLHRYDLPPDGDAGEASSLEREFADYQGQPYCLACASGGYALQLALRAVGVRAGDAVLTNAFTLSPVPGAIAAVGARPVLVETNAELTVDLEHLAARAASTGSRTLLLSHMRGHLADMDAVLDIVPRARADARRGLRAHDGRPLRGHHERYARPRRLLQHADLQAPELRGGRPADERRRDDRRSRHPAVGLLHALRAPRRRAAARTRSTSLRLETPNCSGRMDELRAAILRPQLAGPRRERRALERAPPRDARGARARRPAFACPQPHPLAREVSSSIQFFAEATRRRGQRALPHRDRRARRDPQVVRAPRNRSATPAVTTAGATSSRSALPKTDALLRRLYDCRIPLTFSVEDCRQVAAIVRDALPDVRSAR